MRVLIAVVCVSCLTHPLSIGGQGSRQLHPKIICPMLRPTPAKIVQPVYPKEAKERGIEGDVSLRCIVGKDGLVEKIEVTKGEEPFAQAAKTAVGQWKYEPRILNGVAVEMQTTIHVVFELPKKPKPSRSTGSPNS